MKVLILKSTICPDGRKTPRVLRKDAVEDLPDEVAQKLIDAEKAAEVKEKAPKPERSATPDDTWKLDELTAHAAEKKIDLKGATKKADVLAAIAEAEKAA